MNRFPSPSHLPPLAAGLAFLAFLSAVPCALGAPPEKGDQAPPGASVRDLEAELAGIERELGVLQQRVDILLQDLVDPRITTIAVFFASEAFKDRTPLSLEVLLNGRPMASREFSETDRLVLMKGGALEIHSGILDARQQTLTFRCTISPRGGEGPAEMAASTFALDPVRATKNFVEVDLARGADPKIAPFVLSAKTWSRE